MNKKLLLLTAVIGTFLFNPISTIACTHTISLYDSYGDGWHSNNFVTVYVNGSAVLTDITLASGSGPADYTFNASDGDAIQVTYTSGSWASECYFNISDGCGNNLVSNYYPNTSGTWNGSGYCPPGDQTTYGSGSWIGYVYNPTSYGNFTNYIGYVTESETFNRTHSTVTGATTSLCSNPSDVFSIRYKMNKTFAAGWYNFTVGGDDGVRLSIDGGSTWLVNGWALQGYTTYSSGDVYLDGNYNLVFEYYENTGGAQSSFSYTYSACLACTAGTYNFGTYTPTDSWQTHSSSIISSGCKWYAFNLTAGREYTFKTGCGDGATASFDTYLELYNSGCANVANDDDGCESNRSTITYTAPATGTYYLKMRGYGSNSGSYTLAYQRTPLPGENCSNAQDLASLTSPYSATTTGYANDFSDCSMGSSADRYFYLDVPNNYTIEIWQSWNNYDSRHTMRYGGTCPGTTQIGCIDDSDYTPISWTNTTGSTQRVYWINAGYSSYSGDFTLNWTLTPPPDYITSWISMNYGSNDWCAGETRTVSVTVQNDGFLPWTDGSGNDFNIGIKWNGDPDYLVRVDAQNLAPNSSQTYSFNITAPSTSGTNNLTFDVVKEGCFWFAGNSDGCGLNTVGPGNIAYSSPAINIKPIPTAVSAGSDVTICNGSSANLSGSASGDDVIFEDDFSTNKGWSLGSYWSRGSVTSEPSSDNTPTADNYALACPINSDYGNNWGTYNATSPVINCSNYSNVYLDFYSFKGCESSSFDHMGVQVYNGSSWTTIWSNGSSFQETSWTLNQFDITSYAAGVSNVQIRFYMGTTDGSVVYSGWAIDDIVVRGSNTVSYTWSPTTGLNNPNISNPIASPSTGITTYTMTADLNGCGVSDDVVVTVQSTANNPGVISVPSEICVGTPTNISNTTVATTGTPASSGPNYYFYYRGGPSNIGWQMYDGPTSNSSSALPAAVINTPGQWYVARNSEFGCTGQTNDANTVNIPILVNPSFTAGAINTTGETICYGGDPATIGNSTAASGGDGNITYKWQANGIDIASSNSATYDPPAGLTSNTTYTRWAHDGSCNPSWTQSTGSWTVTVRPNFTAGAINTTGETICYNGDPGVIGSSTAASGGDNSISYEWRANGTPISSSNSATYNPPAGLTATTTYTRWAKDNTCNTSWTQSAGSWVVTVRPNFTAGAINTTGETICEGEIPSTIGSSTASSGGDGIITYKWQANGVDIPSSNSASFIPSEGITVNTTFTRWAHDGTCNTSWEQSTGSWVVTVTQAPFPAGLAAGDYFWTGAENTVWDNTNNWLYYDGSDYSIASVLPTNTSDVFIESYSGTCATTNAITNAGSTVYCEDLNIQTGLSLGGLSTIEVTGDWNNSGIFNAGTGTVKFVGNAQQTITTNGETFNDVVIDNSSGLDAAILLNNDLRVGGQLTLTNGIVNFANPVRKLILGNSATTNAGNANSFVDGIVEKTSCSSLITLPTGNINTRDIGAGSQTYKIWAPIGLNPESSTTVNARYLFSNDGLNQWWYHDWTHEAPLTHTSAREYWLVNSSVNTAVTLYWKDNDPCTIHDFCDGAIFDNSDLTVAYWDNIWKNAGGTASADYIDGSITSGLIPFGAKGESQITFGSKGGGTPLPVDLISFDANCHNDEIEFEWSTATEINNDYFVIEQSDDLSYFEPILKIEGAGNASSINEYLEYYAPESNKNYFRLVQIDFDGKRTEYNPIVLDCNTVEENEPELIAYPNPFNSNLNIELHNFDEENFTIQILDELGRTIIEKQYNNNQTKHIYLNLYDLKPSMYHLKVISDSGILNKKIIKK